MGQSGMAVGSATSLLYELTIAILFYPFIALIIALIFVRATAPLLGSEAGDFMKMVSRLG